MRGAVAHLPEVAGRADDPTPKVLQPDAVDHDPRGQRVRGACDGVRQLAPAAALGERLPVAEHGQEPARHFRAEIILAAADVHALVLGLIHVFEHV